MTVAGMSRFRRTAASLTRSTRITSRLLVRPEPSFKSSGSSVWQSSVSNRYNWRSFCTSARSIWSSEMKLGMGDCRGLAFQIFRHVGRKLDVEILDGKRARNEAGKKHLSKPRQILHRSTQNLDLP